MSAGFIAGTDSDSVRVSIYMDAGNSLHYESLSVDDANAAVASPGWRQKWLNLVVETATEEKSPVRLEIDVGYLPSKVENLSFASNRRLRAKLKKDTVSFVSPPKRAPGGKRGNLSSLRTKNLKLEALDNLFFSVAPYQMYITECLLEDGVLPSEIWGRKLDALYVADTPLRHLPAGMASSPIRSLNVTCCGLEELPDGLEKLWWADMEGNKLTEIPEMGRTVKAKFRCNRISEIPQWAIDKGLYINLHGNPTETGSHRSGASESDYEQLGKINATGSLDLSRNLIRTVPPWVDRAKLADLSENETGTSEILTKVASVPSSRLAG